MLLHWVKAEEADFGLSFAISFCSFSFLFFLFFFFSFFFLSSFSFSNQFSSSLWQSIPSPNLTRRPSCFVILTKNMRHTFRVCQASLNRIVGLFYFLFSTIFSLPSKYKDLTWTKQETDELLDACEKFDLRFAVVFDRLETTKSVEVRFVMLPSLHKDNNPQTDLYLQDLKERYYKITKKVMELRNGAIDPADPNAKALQEELAKYEFDKGNRRLFRALVSLQCAHLLARSLLQLVNWKERHSLKCCIREPRSK